MQEMNPKKTFFQEAVFFMMLSAALLLTFGISKHSPETFSTAGLFWQWISPPQEDWPNSSIYITPLVMNFIALTVVIKIIFGLFNWQPKYYKTLLLWLILSALNFFVYIEGTLRTSFVNTGFPDRLVKAEYGLIIYNLLDTGLF